MMFGRNMIVVGSHGKHEMRAILLGNTLEKVTKHVVCPVMIICRWCTESHRVEWESRECPPPYWPLA